MSRRLPAEWEEQDGILLAWPHENSDWSSSLSLVEPVFTDIAVQASKFERVVIVASDPDGVRRRLERSGAELTRVSMIRLETNDTWSRDFGPVTVLENGSPLILDFAFNGWGLKFAADRDNQVTKRLHRTGIFGATPLRTVGLVLEGGSIESDGMGTIMTTAQCLLSPNRNPHLSREDIEAFLAGQFGADRFLWVNHGFLSGDDTDSHIDTLARLCPDETIMYMKCDEPTDEHYGPLLDMEQDLRSFRTGNGSPFRLIPLPWPAPSYDDQGERLPATYANYLVMNNAVLVPTYRDKSDETALDIVRGVFPCREVIGIDCLPLLLQHGSLHCVTMQIPKGVLS
jgi:agmatine deiminase